MRRFAALADHPFELLFGGLSLASGVVLLAGVLPPASLDAILPQPVVWAWGALQALGGGLIVAGLLLRYSDNLFLLSLRLERAGMWPLAAATVVYSAVALAYAGTRALYPASVLAAISVACAARAIKVRKLERTIMKHTQGGSVGE